MRMNGAMRTLKSNYGDIEGDSEHGGGGYHMQPGTGVYLPQGIAVFLTIKSSYQIHFQLTGLPYT